MQTCAATLSAGLKLRWSAFGHGLNAFFETFGFERPVLLGKFKRHGLLQLRAPTLSRCVARARFECAD